MARLVDPPPLLTRAGLGAAGAAARRLRPARRQPGFRDLVLGSGEWLR